MPLNIDNQINVTNVTTQALAIQFSGTRLNILAVAGPMGPSGANGIDGTGAAARLTGIFPILYDQGSGVVGILSGYYATVSQLTGASGALVAQIAVSNAGVTSLNGLSGAINVAGTGSIIASVQGQRLIISGSGLVAYADITALSGWALNTFATIGNLGATGGALYGLITGFSGVFGTSGAQLGATIAATGQQAWTAADINARTLSGNLTQTGVQIESQITALSGALIASGGALSAVKVSGSVIIPIADFSGIGGTIVLYSGGKVFISGGASSAIDHGDGINLSGQLQTTGSYLYRTITGASGYIITLISAASAGVSSLNGASGVMTLQGAGNVSITTVGQTITVSGNTGDYALFATKVALTQSGVDILNALVATGGALVARENALSGVLDARLALTGSGLYALTTGASGQYVNDLATKTALTQTGVQLGAALALTGSGLYALATGMSGAFIARENGISGVIDGRLALTGSGLHALVTGASGQYVNDFATKAALIQTGIQLGATIALTGSGLYVMITGMSGQGVTDYATKAVLIATGAVLSAVKVTGSPIIPVANFSGIGGTSVIWLGNLILVSGTAGGGGVSQGQLDALSGFSTGTFATIINLAQTGSDLQAQIRALTGLGTSLAFDIGRNIVVPSGTGSFPVTFSRDLGATAFVIPVMSNNSGDPTIACYPSGATNAGFTLVMSATVPTSGYRLSYLATTGSGYVVLGQSTGNGGVGGILGQVVYTTGNQSIGDVKTFNSGLFTGAIGIGTTSPLFPLVVDTSVNLNVAGSPSILVQGSGNRERISVRSVDNDATISVQHGRSTGNGSTLIGDALGYFFFGGFNGSNWVNTAGFNGIASENFGTGNGSGIGTHISIFTIPATSDPLSSISRKERIRITDSGNVGIGTITPRYVLEVTGNVGFNAGQYEQAQNITSNYSIQGTDRRIYCNNASGITLNLGSVITYSGQFFGIKIMNTGFVVLTGVFGQKLDGSDSYIMNGQYSSHEFHSNGANWCIW